jgi:hypothetical protein
VHTAYRAIDHVVVRLQTAEPLFALLSDTFGLPVAWPLQRAEFATYGWIHVGNTDIELWAAAANDDLPVHAQPPLIHGFALEPAQSLPDSLAWMDQAGLSVRAPRAYRSLNASGEQVTNFTNAVVQDLSAPSCCVFFCEWDRRATIYPWAEPATPPERRAKLGSELERRGGGPLGITGLQAIRLGTPELKVHQRQWQALTGARAGQPMFLTPDIALELIPAEHLAIDSITLGIRSLEVARKFLLERGWIPQDDGTTLGIAPEGLRIQLKEAASASA